MTQLRAVFDDGTRHDEGTVRGMWSAGLVVESAAPLPAGSMVALVVLSGGFDGERLAAKVSSTEKGTIMLDLMDLDMARWSRLQALVDGQPPALSMPIDRPAKAPPPDAPVFIVSGGEDDLGDPTGAVPLSIVVQAPPVPALVPTAGLVAAVGAVPASPFEVPSPLDPVRRAAPQPAPAMPVVDSTEGEIELQLIELVRRNSALADEVTKLKADNARLTTQLALKDALEEELAEALERVETLERAAKG